MVREEVELCGSWPGMTVSFPIGFSELCIIASAFYDSSLQWNLGQSSRKKQSLVNGKTMALGSQRIGTDLALFYNATDLSI